MENQPGLNHFKTCFFYGCYNEEFFLEFFIEVLNFFMKFNLIKHLNVLLFPPNSEYNFITSYHLPNSYQLKPYQILHQLNLYHQFQ
jgi:hypothetical protein